MKIIQVLTTSILFLLPGAIVPAYARGQHEQEKQSEQKEAKPAQQPQHAVQQKQAKPAQQSQPAAQHAAQPREAKPAQQPRHAAQQREAKPKQQPQHAAQQPEAKPAQQRQGAQQANRGKSSGGRGSIPEARFRSNFGRSHTFHVNRSQFAHGPGHFQYGGYWFITVDPWPVEWLYTDDVYVDYLNGGYFLCDPIHPGVYISINIG